MTQGSCSKARKPPRFWTLVLLTSSGNIELPFVYGLNNCDMLQGMVLFVYQVLCYLRDTWGELVDYFDNFLDDGRTFLIAKEHDTFLVDDESTFGVSAACQSLYFTSMTPFINGRPAEIYRQQYSTGF
jgi:hypothetical protein